MVYQLSDDPNLFPNPYYGDEDGLIAVGGDLSVDRLIAAYSNGIFPWYGFKEEEEILWWCPLRRFVIFPKEIHISHSMRQLIKKGTYDVTINQAFSEVIQHCSTADNRINMEGAWLGKDMIEAYTNMYDLGLAASVEVWEKGDENDNDNDNDNEDDNDNENDNDNDNDNENEDRFSHRRLVGGLYGINIGNNFFGESMFSLVPNASKLALIALAQFIEPYGGLIDCQLETSHLKSMGGRYIDYEEYMKYLNMNS